MYDRTSFIEAVLTNRTFCKDRVLDPLKYLPPTGEHCTEYLAHLPCVNVNRSKVRSDAPVGGHTVAGKFPFSLSPFPTLTPLHPQCPGNSPARTHPAPRQETRMSFKDAQSANPHTSAIGNASLRTGAHTRQGARLGTISTGNATIEVNISESWS